LGMATTATPVVAPPTSRRDGASLGPRRSIAVVMLALAATVSVAALDLRAHDWDVTRFLRVGEVSAARPFVAEDMPDTQTVSGWGHDGQNNYVLAAVFPDLAAAEGHLDSVTYRARRIVYPALVSPAPPGRPLAIALVTVNLVAIAATALAVAELARQRGASPLVGAVVGATPALLASVLLDLGDATALALVGWGAVLWERSGRPRTTLSAVSLLTLAGLTRETTLVVPAALALAALIDRTETDRRVHRPPPGLLLTPFAVVAAWVVILDIWIGGPGKSATQFTFPLVGWIREGVGSTEITVAAVLVALSIWVGWRLWTTDRAWALVVLAEAVVLCCVDDDVLFHPLNLARVTSWVIPWAAILFAADARSTRHPVSGATAPGTSP
jgi:hypothetical protein